MVFARQVPPDTQESPLFISEEMFPNNIILHGNRDYYSHTIYEFDQILNHFEDMADDWDAQTKRYKWTGGKYVMSSRKPDLTITEMLQSYGFERNDGKPWTTRQRHEWKKLMESDKSAEAIMTAALLLMTGKKWQQAQITGSCQRDWQTVYYPVDEWDAKDIEVFESQYFNMGSEWIIHEGEPPLEPEDIEGGSIYCTAFGAEGIRKEIAEHEGVAPGDVYLYRHAGYVKKSVYEPA